MVSHDPAAEATGATRRPPGCALGEGGQLLAAGALTPGVSQSGGFSLLRAWARRQGQVPRPPDPPNQLRPPSKAPGAPGGNEQQDRRAPGSQSQRSSPTPALAELSLGSWPLWVQGGGAPAPSTRFRPVCGGTVASSSVPSVRSPRKTRSCSHQGGPSTQVWCPNTNGTSWGPV